MKKLLLTLALLLGMSVAVTVPTHACDNCADVMHVVETSLEDVAVPYAARCTLCGGTTSQVTNKEYEYLRFVQCTHGKTARDYIYKVYTTTSYKCNSCGTSTHSTTTTSHYTSCGKKMYNHAD